MPTVISTENVRFQVCEPNRIANRFRSQSGVSLSVDLYSCCFNEGEVVDASALPQYVLRPLLLLLGGSLIPDSGTLKSHGKAWIGVNPRSGQKGKATLRQNVILRGWGSGFSGVHLQDYYSSVMNYLGPGFNPERILKSYSAVERADIVYAMLQSIDPDIILMEEWFNSPVLSKRKEIEQLLLSKLDKARVSVVGFNKRIIKSRFTSKLVLSDNNLELVQFS